jgi:hypothetical protein
MNAESPLSPLEGITYRDQLPVDWQVLTELPSAGEQHRLDRANEELLRALLLRDEAPQDSDEMEEGGGMEHFRRLEAKLDLLLGLFTEMLSTQGGLPLQHDLLLGTRGLCISARAEDITSLNEGMLLKIRLYLDAQLPRPLEIYGYLTAMQVDGFTVSFYPLQERVQDLLDKYVFRQHRRAIAQRKRTV